MSKGIVSNRGGIQVAAGGATVLQGEATGQTGVTITFVQTYTFGATGVLLYRNGVLMDKVGVFSGGSNNAEEYQEINNGANSTQITLNGTDPATADELFQLVFLEGTVTVGGSSSAGDSDTIHLIRAATDGLAGMELGSITSPLPDFTSVVSNIFKFNVTTVGALLTNDGPEVYVLGGAASAVFDAFGTSRAINAGQRGKDTLISMLYRTLDTIGDSQNAQHMLWVFDDTNGRETTFTNAGPFVAGTSILVGSTTGMTVSEKIFTGDSSGGTFFASETVITEIVDATHIKLADNVDCIVGDRLATGVLTNMLTTFDAHDDDTNQTGAEKKLYIKTADNTESITIMVQKLETGTNLGMYFDNILISTDPFKKVETTTVPDIVENILSSDATANADIADLTFTGLTIGANYSLKGQIVLDSNDGFINGIQFMGGSSLTGTTHGRVELVNETVGDLTIVTSGVSLEFTADSTTLYTNKDTADKTVFGDGTKGGTFLQLREIPQKGTSIIVESADSMQPESIEYTGYTSDDASGYVLFANEIRNTGSKLLTVTNSGYTKIIALEDCFYSAVYNGAFSVAINAFYITHLDSSDTVLKQTYNDNSGNINGAGSSLTGFMSAGDYIRVTSNTTHDNNFNTNFQVTAFPNREYKPLLAIPTITVGQNAEEYSMSAATANFFDATGDTYQFDTSLIPLTDSLLIEWEDTTQTRLKAKARCRVVVTLNSLCTSGASLITYTSAGVPIGLAQQTNTGFADTLTSQVLLEAGDYIYFRNSGSHNREGGLNILVTPELGQQNHAAILSQPTCLFYATSQFNTSTATVAGVYADQTTLNALKGQVAECAVTEAGGILTFTEGGFYDMEISMTSWASSGWLSVAITDSGNNIIEEWVNVAYTVNASASIQGVPVYFQQYFKAGDTMKIRVKTVSNGSSYYGPMKITRKS